ncbi:MAG: FAD-dependent oxidoreductase [Tepidisphaeraceae bacterium]
MPTRELKTDVLIIGGGTGGVAAALGAAALGKSVILAEETDWIGGQLTSQAVPPDENSGIRAGTHGATKRYFEFRRRVRDYYRENLPLTEAANQDPKLNPGGGGVSPICHEPRIALAALEAMLAPHRTTGRIRVLLRHKPTAATTDGGYVQSVSVQNLTNKVTVTLRAKYVLDATELGELLPLTGTEYVSGAEAKSETGEPHGADRAQADNVQSFTWCFPVAFDPTDGADHTIDKPAQWERWRNYVPSLNPPWPGKMLSWTYSNPHTLEPITRVLFPQETKNKEGNLWNYRKIVRNDIYLEGHAPHEVTLVNWPQNDYWEHNVIDKPADQVAVWLEEAKQLSLSLLYWMQTEAPRPDGKAGYRGLYLRPDLVGTSDGLAMAPYFRESRRIKAVFTVTEKHVGLFGRYGVEAKGRTKEMTAEQFADSVGIGHYNIDLHPTTAGVNYIDVPALPFQVPLGALIPVRMENLLPACKNLGVTHLTNGCYRLHPVEWNIGESAGLLAAFCIEKKVSPRAVREKKALLEEFQTLLRGEGVKLNWAG